MKNVLKTLAIIALVAVIGFSFTACGGDDDGGGGGAKNELSGTVTVANGEIEFRYDISTSISGTSIISSRGGMTGIAVTHYCTFTTDLPAPNDSIPLSYYLGFYIISGLTDGQTVKWTAKIRSGTLTKKDSSSNTVSVQGHGNYID